MQHIINEQIPIAELFDAQPEAVMWYTPLWSEEGEKGDIIDFVLRYCNDEIGRQLGIPKEKLIGQTILTTNLASEAERKVYFSEFLHVWQTGERQVSSYFHSGLGQHLEAVRTRVKGGIISITRNRTAEVAVHQELRKQENKFKSIINTSRDGVMLLEPIWEGEQILDFRLQYCNDFALSEGHLQKEDIGKTLLELYPHLKESEQFELHKKVVVTGQPQRFETTFRTSDGREYGWFIVSLTKIEEGLISRFTDISTKKEYERQIEEQRDLLEGILDASLNAVFACDAIRDSEGNIIDLLILKTNPAFSRITHKSPEEAEGARFLSLFPDTKKAGIFERYCQVIETGNSLKTEMAYKGEGIDGWFEIGAVKRGKDGIAVSFTDTTESKRFKQQLESLVEQLKQSNQNLEEFAYAASHDLQEPLRKISTFSNRLKQDLGAQLNETQLQLFERMEGAAKRMRGLIEDLLAYSMFGNQANLSGEVNLADLVQQVLQDLETVVQETGARLSIDQLPLVKGDSRQLRQVFHNLIGNALKYRKPDTTPEVTLTYKKVEKDHPALLPITLPGKGPFHFFEVADNGIGFEQQYAEKIFQVFQRLHGRAEYQGTGVGLAIVKKVVENHHGVIWAEGEPGKGAFFRFILPV